MTKEDNLRVMIAGGGTGGHVYPGIAIYRALERQSGGIDVLFVGAKSGVEGTIFKDLDLPHVLLAGRGVRGGSLIRRLISPFVLAGSILRGIGEIQKFKPDVVIGTGGFASVAIVVASVVCRKKRVLQEQNSVPGMANRVLSRFAQLVLLSYQESRSSFGARVPCAVVGNPLRVRPDKDREAAFRFLNLVPGLPTVLVFGGSRGAHAINEAASAAIRSIVSRRDVQFVFLTGANDYQQIRDMFAAHDGLVRVMPFLEEIGCAYAVADLAVSRAGASAVFELAAFGVPSIFVPYPYAADDHQARNVAELAADDAAVVIEDRRLDAETLDALIVSLLDDGKRRSDMAGKMKAWSKSDADDLAAARVIELAGPDAMSLEQLEVLPAAG